MTYIPGGGGGGGNIATSADVALNNPANGQPLIFDGGLNKWRNDTIAPKDTYVARVIYNNTTSAWPVRPAGIMFVEWVGPVDPGGAALNGDTWINTSQG